MPTVDWSEKMMIQSQIYHQCKQHRISHKNNKIIWVDALELKGWFADNQDLILRVMRMFRLSFKT